MARRAAPAHYRIIQVPMTPGTDPDEGSSDYWRDVKAHNDARKARNLSRANQKASEAQIPWIKHTQYHWSYRVGDHLLDYWPSTDKFRFRNKGYHGGVIGFIRNQEKLLKALQSRAAKSPESPF